MSETPAEFNARMRSIGYLKGGRTRDRICTIAHPETGERAKQTTDELGTVITETDSRQDVNIHPETHILDMSIGI